MTAPAPTAELRAPDSERLSARTLTAYGSLQLGLNAASTMCLVHLLFFYTDVVRLNPAAAGLVMLIGHFWDGITDPIMGYISDRTRSLNGRRRPYFVPGAISMALFFALLFMPSAALEGRGLFWYMLAMYLLFCTGRTVLDVPYNALAPDLTRHYDERSRLAGWRMGLSVFGDMCGGLLPIALLFALGEQRQAFQLASGTLAVVAVACGIFGRWGTYERNTGLPVAPSTRKRSFRPDRLMRRALAPLWSGPAAILVLTYGLVVIGTGFPYTTFRYVSKYFFHDPGMDLLIMICYQVAGLCGAPAWIWISRRVSKQHAYQAAIFGYVFSTLPVLFCAYDDRSLFLTAMALCGFCGTGVWMVPTAIAPDVIEWQKLHRDVAHEGAFYGMWAFTSKFAGGVTPWIVGTTLNAVGWVPDVVQDGRVLQAILALFVIFPLGFMGLGVLIFTWYPISRHVYDDVMQQLDARAETPPQ